MHTIINIFKIGIDEERLTTQNPIDTTKNLLIKTSKIRYRYLNADRLIVYPVRATRRKNFGELLLGSSRSKGCSLRTTRTNNKSITTSMHVAKNCKSKQLTYFFGIGECNRWSFENIISSAEAIITTSIAEGWNVLLRTMDNEKTYYRT